MQVKLLGLLCMLVVACGASTAQAATPPTKTAPFGLPWAAGTTAVLDAGPHTNNVHECLSGQACNALDFTPATGLVTAAGPGVVQSVPYSCAPGLVVIRQKTGSSYNGWYTGYYHLANIRVHAGQTVSEGQVIASLAQNEAQATPCGGSWSGPHVHFFVKYTTGSLGDPFQNTAPDVDLQDIVIGGWKITKEGYSAYAPQGCMTYLATGEKVCSPSGVVKNYAPPSVNPLTNGMYVTVGSSGPVYEIVGGAPLYVSNWAAVGGAHTVNTITQQQFESLNSVPAPGTIVNAVTSTGKEYGAFVIAGGAPLWISKWSAVGGEPANLQQIDAWDVQNAANPMSHLNQVPTQGTIVNATTASGAEYGAFVVVGGAPLWISNWKAVGGEPKVLVRVDAYDIQNTSNPASHLNQYPANGTIVNAVTVQGKEYGAFVIAGGAPLWISKWSAVGGEPDPLIQIDAYDIENPSNPASHLRKYPADGTIVNAVTAAGKEYGAFVIAGGAPLYISKWSAVGGEPTVLPTIDAWDIQNAGRGPSHLIPQPAGGTFLQTLSGAVYRVAGGAAISSDGWSVFGGVQPHTIFDPWDLTNTSDPLDHLSAAPVNGTIVEGLPSHAYWQFEGGKRSSTGASAAAVAVADSGLAAFPLASQPSPPGHTGGGHTAVRCVVPHLRHDTLSQAKRALRRAHCGLGKIKRSRHHRRHHTLRVAKQSARPHSRHRRGYRVGITLG